MANSDVISIKKCKQLKELQKNNGIKGERTF